MEIGVLKARPPHVKFVTRAVEDRNASIQAGHTVFKDVAHVVITPQGSRDSVEKPAEEWLATVDQQVREDRMPEDWAEKFHRAYDHYKRGEEIPVDGFALAVWPSITPAELQACKNVGILSVEDLAIANDEAIRRLGLGGLALKQRAGKFLEAAKGPGKLLAENAALEERLKASEVRRESLEERVKALEALVGGASPVKVIPPSANVEDKV